MLCIICGCICDFNDTFICDVCQRGLDQANETTMLFALLNAAQEYCPFHLQHKIEDVLGRIISPEERFNLHLWIKSLTKI